MVDVHEALAELTRNLQGADAERTDVLVQAAKLALGEPAHEHLDALAALSKRLYRSNCAREQMLAGVAHDLRNPLNTLAMSTGLLKDDLAGDSVEAKRELALVARIERAADRMKRLVDDLAEVSRIEAHTVELHVKAENVASIVKDSLAQAEGAAKDRGGSVKLGLLAEDSTALVDRARLSQTIAKMAAMGARLTGEGGVVTFVVLRTDAFVVVKADVRANRSAPITMPDENRGGIALLILSSLVQLLGSTLSMKTEDGVAVISFTLPSVT